MIKKIISACFVLSIASGVNAVKNCLTLELKTGEKYHFLLDSNPEASLIDGNFVMNDQNSTTFAISNVNRFYFTESSITSSDEYLSKEFSIVSLDATSIKVYNAKSAEKITLTSVNGIVVFESVTDESGIAIIALPNQNGVYVLRIGEKSLKVIRK